MAVINSKEALPLDQKLWVIYRVEPSCLGPQGQQYIHDFCRYAQAEADAWALAHVHWQIVPRLDKGLAELQYHTRNKQLSRIQVKQYLALFHRELEAFESDLESQLAQFIDVYMAQLNAD